MCFIVRNIADISNTKIFSSVVYPVKYNKDKRNIIDHPLQFIIYSNKTEQYYPENHLIIPFPLLKGSNRAKILDNKYADFFDDISIMFRIDLDRDLDLRLEQRESIIISNFMDLCIFLRQHYSTPENIITERNDLEVIQNMKQFYSEGFGFVVMKLKTGTEGNVVSFVFEIPEDKKIFLPTRMFFTRKINDFNPSSDDPLLHGIYDMDFIDSEDPDGHLGKNNITSHGEILSEKFLNYSLRRKSIIKKDESFLQWDHIIYINNFPRVEKNPLLKKRGIKLSRCEENKIPNFNLYVTKDNLPSEIAIAKTAFLYELIINREYIYNHDFYL